MPIGILITVLGVVEQLSWPAIEIANVIRDLHVTNCIKKDFYTGKVDLTDFQDESSNNENTQSILPDIKFSNVSFSYKTKNILNDFNFCFKANKKHLILGGSGQGKTTLLKLILDYYSPQNGKVIFDPTSGANIYELFSVARQNEKLFIASLYFNLTLGRNISEEKVKKCLNKLKLNYLCANENLKRADNPISLSGGEIGRVLLAKALLLDKRVIILDEPLAGLDENIRKQVKDIICNLLNVALIVVSHSFSKEKTHAFEKIVYL